MEYDLINVLESEIKNILLNNNLNVNEVKIISSLKPELGDLQYNGIMALAKQNNMNPISLANEIASVMNNTKYFKDANVAGPGFINFKIKDEVLVDFMNRLNYKPKESNGKTIVLDYGGPNVAKTLHVGHLRAANIGEALKRLLRYMGYKVIGDVHLGDWGRPLGLIILELKKRHPKWVYFDENYEGVYPKEDPLTVEELNNIYPYASNKSKEDENYLEEARIITYKLQQKEKGYYDLWKKIVEVSVRDIKSIYKELNVSFDLWYGESDAEPYIKPVIDYFKDNGYTTTSEGALVVDVSREDDKTEMPPLLLIKSNGSVSYETTDVATIYQRIKDFDPNEILYVVDKRQSIHFDQVFRACYKSKLVKENVNLELLGFGTVNGKDGKPYKTRNGGIMTLRDLIEEVKNATYKNLNPNLDDKEKESINNILAISTLKYADLLSNRSTDYIFDIEKFSDLNGKTGVYLLYSVIRMKSLLNKADIKDYKYTKVVNEYDKNIILKLLEFNNILNVSLKEKSLNYITDYIYNLNSLFNSFYSSNMILTNNDESIKSSWLYLTNKVLEANLTLLDILAIDVPDKM